MANKFDTTISSIENSISFIKEYHWHLDWSDQIRLDSLNLLLQNISDRVELSREYEARNGSLDDWEREENRRLDADAMRAIRSVQGY